MLLQASALPPQPQLLPLADFDRVPKELPVKALDRRPQAIVLRLCDQPRHHRAGSRGDDDIRCLQRRALPADIDYVAASAVVEIAHPTAPASGGAGHGCGLRMGGPGW